MEAVVTMMVHVVDMMVAHVAAMTVPLVVAMMVHLVVAMMVPLVVDMIVAHVAAMMVPLVVAMMVPLVVAMMVPLVVAMMVPLVAAMTVVSVVATVVADLCVALVVVATSATLAGNSEVIMSAIMRVAAVEADLLTSPMIVSQTSMPEMVASAVVGVITMECKATVPVGSTVVDPLASAGAMAAMVAMAEVTGSNVTTVASSTTVTIL